WHGDPGRLARTGQRRCAVQGAAVLTRWLGSRDALAAGAGFLCPLPPAQDAAADAGTASLDEMAQWLQASGLEAMRSAACERWDPPRTARIPRPPRSLPEAIPFVFSALSCCFLSSWSASLPNGPSFQ